MRVIGACVTFRGARATESRIRQGREDRGQTAGDAPRERVAQRAVADRLLLLAADSEAAPEVRAMAELRITELRPLALSWSKQATRSEDDRAHWLAIATDFWQWIDKRELPALTKVLVAPPGDPF